MWNYCTAMPGLFRLPVESRSVDVLRGCYWEVFHPGKSEQQKISNVFHPAKSEQQSFHPNISSLHPGKKWITKVFIPNISSLHLFIRTTLIFFIPMFHLHLYNPYFFITIKKISTRNCLQLQMYTNSLGAGVYAGFTVHFQKGVVCLDQRVIPWRV